MNILDIIAKKRDKKELNKEEIDFFVNGYTNGDVTDYQAAALIMAIYLNGMSNEEITNLTLAMAYSGEVLNLSKLGENVVDKHSTGGIGDKVTLILMPVVAALGVPVAKISGRGLGFTGGTVDKLESIPGYNTQISVEEFIENVEKIGISLMGQTLNLAPADKKIYALRDSISCVENIPLIASSIMSKKIASGANKIVLEVTVGNGAFMKNIDDARKLSETMINIGKLANKEVVCILTNMDEPLGFAVGNSLEVIESIETLKGKGPKDLTDLVIELGSLMVSFGLEISQEDAKEKVKENLFNNKAYSKFEEWVKRQGGNIEEIEVSKHTKEVLSKEEGYISKIDALKIGNIARELGAGRLTKDDIINHKVGIVLNKKVGDKIEKGEKILTVYYDEIKPNENDIYESIKIAKDKVEASKLIIDIIK